MKKIQDLIQKKMSEHKVEIEGSMNMIEQLKKQQGQKPNFDSVGKMITLKDKILFHKSAVAVLEDLLTDLDN